MVVLLSMVDMVPIFRTVMEIFPVLQSTAELQKMNQRLNGLWTVRKIVTVLTIRGKIVMIYRMNQTVMVMMLWTSHSTISGYFIGPTSSFVSKFISALSLLTGRTMTPRSSMASDNVGSTSIPMACNPNKCMKVYFGQRHVKEQTEFWLEMTGLMDATLLVAIFV